MTTKSKMKLIKNVLNLPTIEVDNPEVLGVDRWKQVDILSPQETNLLAGAGIAEHPTESVWEPHIWWHQITLILDGRLTIQDLSNGNVYEGKAGDLFYWAPTLRARMGGKFRCYFVKTPMNTRWVKRPSGKMAFDLLNKDDGVVPQGAAPDYMRKGKSESKLAGSPVHPRIKFVKNVAAIKPIKVDQPGKAVDVNWHNIAYVNPVDSDLVMKVGFTNHASKSFVDCDHRWHQIVLVRGGEMINEDVDTGEFFKGQAGDVFYWPPGLRHTVGGEFQVMASKTPEPLRWIMTPQGKKELNLFNVEGEYLYPGSPPDKVQKEPIQHA